uniref:Uncharacterized protein n=1 Tax=Rhizoctonia solani TaxID=456999 RepID=N0ACX8_9AGAM|nr:hypothetical protein RSOL_m01280 [Rhizoctonia solani]AGK45440.1 hypothetical protein RSOL_m01280 [Rhizoctonia solani]
MPRLRVILWKINFTICWKFLNTLIFSGIRTLRSCLHDPMIFFFFRSSTWVDLVRPTPVGDTLKTDFLVPHVVPTRGRAQKLEKSVRSCSSCLNFLPHTIILKILLLRPRDCLRCLLAGI